MRVFNYYGHEEVNRSDAEKFATKRRIDLRTYDAKDGPPDTHGAPSVVDLDSLTTGSDERDTFVRTYSRRPLHHPMAVFSYGLSSGATERLRRNGVLVFKRLHTGVFADLLRKVENKGIKPPTTIRRPHWLRRLGKWIGVISGRIGLW